MSYGDPIAYTYEADVHCPPCALRRFGPDADHPQWVDSHAEDREGNEPGAIAPWDTDPDHSLVCGTCGAVIYEAPRIDDEIVDAIDALGGFVSLCTEDGEIYAAVFTGDADVDRLGASAWGLPVVYAPGTREPYSTWEVEAATVHFGEALVLAALRLAVETARD